MTQLPNRNENVITLHAVGDVAVLRKNWMKSLVKVESILTKGDISFFN